MKPSINGCSFVCLCCGLASAPRLNPPGAFTYRQSVRWGHRDQPSRQAGAYGAVSLECTSQGITDVLCLRSEFLLGQQSKAVTISSTGGY